MAAPGTILRTVPNRNGRRAFALRRTGNRPNATLRASTANARPYDGRPPTVAELRRRILAVARLAGMSRPDIMRPTPASIAAGLRLPATVWRRIADLWRRFPPSSPTERAVGDRTARRVAAPDLQRLLEARGWHVRRSGHLMPPPRDRRLAGHPWTSTSPAVRRVLAGVVAWVVARREVYGG